MTRPTRPTEHHPEATAMLDRCRMMTADIDLHRNVVTALLGKRRDLWLQLSARNDAGFRRVTQRDIGEASGVSSVAVNKVVMTARADQ